jgi:hypothetical protein
VDRSRHPSFGVLVSVKDGASEASGQWNLYRIDLRGMQIERLKLVVDRAFFLPVKIYARDIASCRLRPGDQDRLHECIKLIEAGGKHGLIRCVQLLLYPIVILMPVAFVVAIILEGYAACWQIAGHACVVIKDVIIAQERSRDGQLDGDKIPAVVGESHENKDQVSVENGLEERRVNGISLIFLYHANAPAVREIDEFHVGLEDEFI